MKTLKGSIGFGLVSLLAVPTFAGPDSNDPGQAVNRVHSVAGRSYYVVQMAPKVTAASRSRLEATGIRILRYVPQDSFIVSSSPEVKAKAKMKGLPGVLSVRDLQPAEKLSPGLDVKYDAQLNSRIEDDRRSAPEWAGTMAPVDTRVWIDVRIAPMEASAAVEVARAVESLGGSTVNVSSIGLGSVTARVRRESLVELAATPGVLWIERDVPMHLQNDIARWTIQSTIESADEDDAAPIHAHGIHGEGQIVTIADNGIEITHQMFAHSVPPGCPCGTPGCTCLLPGDTHRKIRAYYSFTVPEPEMCPTATSYSAALHDTGCLNHGSFVAGVVAGDAWPFGTYEPTLAVTLAGSTAENGPHDGQAFGARIEVQGARPNNLECMFPPLIDPSRFPAGTPGKNFSWIHTNSWSNSGPANYGDHSAQIDNFVHANPDMTVIFAAGNFGGPTPLHTSTANSESVAKNVIGVGATENAHAQNGHDADDLWVSSSRGPSADGRIKPDVLAPTGVWSAEGCEGTRNGPLCLGPPLELPECEGDKYIHAYGTSFSAPAVAGAAALVRQYFMEGWYPGGVLGSGPELVPSAALIKATLINSAQEITGDNAYDHGNIYPNNDQGWGRILLDAVLQFQDDTRHLVVHDERTGLDQGGLTTYSFYNSSASIPLKATLVWSDPPGSPTSPTSIKLVNDLDLVVTAPDQQTVYVGNRFTGYNPGHSQPYSPSNLPEPDNVNNVEGVLVLQPQIGTWTVSVKAQHVPMGSQSYALVLTGANDQDSDGDPDTSDCAPANPAVSHGATEVCNGIDDNCSGVIDETFPNCDGDALANCVDPDDDNDGEPDTTDFAPCDPTTTHTFTLTIGSCNAGGLIILENTGSATPIDVRLYVVLSEYKFKDPDCTAAIFPDVNDVQVNNHIEDDVAQGVLGKRFISYANLGFVVPPAACNVAILTVQAVRVDTGEPLAADCTSQGAIAANLPIVAASTAQPEFLGSVHRGNEIDVAGIGGASSCLGTREYSPQLEFYNSFSNYRYRVTLDAKYECTDSSDVVCTSATPPLGVGWNRGVVTDTDFRYGDLQAVNFVNGSGTTALPSCCQSAWRAGECFTFVVTQRRLSSPSSIVAIRPAVIYSLPLSYDGNGFPAACNFFPTNSNAALRNDAFCDPDGDGFLGSSPACGSQCNECEPASCDNCPMTFQYPSMLDGDSDGVGNACDNCVDVYNPSQADSDADGIGNACDFSGGPCQHCVAPAGFCADVELGMPCGQPACGGVCRVCNGQIDCFKQ